LCTVFKAGHLRVQKLKVDLQVKLVLIFNNFSEAIRALVTELEDSGFSIKCLWAPGHEGIESDEKADLLAKPTSNIHSRTVNKIPFSGKIPHFYKIIKKLLGAGSRHRILQQLAGLKLFTPISLDSLGSFIQNFPDTMLLHFLGLDLVLISFPHTPINST